MEEPISYQRQHLDQLLQFLGENIPRPQQSYEETRQRLQELMPLVYTEVSENLQPMDLVQIDSYRGWINLKLSDLSIQAWLQRVKGALYPERGEGGLPWSVLERDRVLLMQYFPIQIDRKNRLLQSLRCLELFGKEKADMDAFFINAEEMALEVLDLQMGQIKGIKDTCVERYFLYLKTEFPVVRADQVRHYKAMLKAMNTLVSMLEEEVDENIARLSYEDKCRYLLRNHLRFSWLLKTKKELFDLPEMEEPPRNALLTNPRWVIDYFNQQVLEYLCSITMILDQKLGELYAKPNESGSQV